MRQLRLFCGTVVAVLVTAGSGASASDPGLRADWPLGSAVVSYTSAPAFERALARHPAAVLRRLPTLRIAVVRPSGDVAAYAATLAAEPGIERVERVLARRSYAEPGLVAAPGGRPLQWQYAAIGADAVPPEVARAASAFTIAVIDTGADLGAPDLAAKAPVAFSVRGRTSVGDVNGHGTFVAALAAGSVSNGDGIAGAGGDARLMVVQAGDSTGAFTDVQEAAAIVSAVDRGARILNLSLGGPTTSSAERRAVEYAVGKGVLLVAAVGNGHADGDPVDYPAGLLQPVGSRGAGGRGLAVAASNRAGTRASFSTVGTHVSLAAPGVNVFSAVSAAAPAGRYPRTELPGSAAGEYGFGSGTSFAAPQVAGAAALVWAANPQLRAEEVAAILKETASGAGVWTPQLGFGVIDVAAAVERARNEPSFRLAGTRTGTRVDLSWPAVPGAAGYRIAVSEDGGPAEVLAEQGEETEASFELATGSVYAFTVTALGADGAEVAATRPWTASLRRAAAELTLEAARRAGSRNVSLGARLSVGESPGAAVARTVVLESFDGSRWSRAATGVTDADGRVAWRYTLAPGRYRLRARYPGTAEIAPARSRAVSLVVA